MSRYFPKTVVIGVVSTELFAPNPNRKVIILSALAAGRYSVSFGDSAVLDRGITIHAATSPVILDEYNCPGVLHESIHAIASGAGSAGIAEISNP